MNLLNFFLKVSMLLALTSGLPRLFHSSTTVGKPILGCVFVSEFIQQTHYYIYPISTQQLNLHTSIFTVYVITLRDLSYFSLPYCFLYLTALPLSADMAPTLIFTSILVNSFPSHTLFHTSCISFLPYHSPLSCKCHNLLYIFFLPFFQDILLIFSYQFSSTLSLLSLTNLFSYA